MSAIVTETAIRVDALQRAAHATEQRFIKMVLIAMFSSGFVGAISGALTSVAIVALMLNHGT